MAKILQGKVISNKMNGTVVVQVSRRVPHKLYRKIIKTSKKYKVATNGEKLELGQVIKIIETRPVSKDKHFAVFTDEKKPTVTTVKAKTVKTNKEIKA
jgi:small subunit ribosomal protein S17